MKGLLNLKRVMAMKGIIVQCLKETVLSKFGIDIWEKSLIEAGFKAGSIFSPASNIDDEVFKTLIRSLCKNLNTNCEKLTEEFGDHWVNDFSQKMYSHLYLKHKKAKDFLLDMGHIHVATTRNIENAHPPRFEYEWKDEYTLIMHYKSHRGLLNILIGLVKGVGKYYNEELTVEQQGSDKIEITFKEKQNFNANDTAKISCVK